AGPAHHFHMEPTRSSSSATEEEEEGDLPEVASKHAQMMGVLQRRQEQARKLKEFWERGNVQALSGAVDKDAAVFCDFARSVMQQRLQAGLNLDACQTLLQIVQDLLCTGMRTSLRRPSSLPRSCSTTSGSSSPRPAAPAGRCRSGSSTCPVRNACGSAMPATATSKRYTGFFRMARPRRASPAASEGACSGSCRAADGCHRGPRPLADSRRAAAAVSRR
ncbi:unnamed protein product, partial [Prorocentrum cordatum]